MHTLTGIITQEDYEGMQAEHEERAQVMSELYTDLDGQLQEIPQGILKLRSRNSQALQKIRRAQNTRARK